MKTFFTPASQPSQSSAMPCHHPSPFAATTGLPQSTTGGSVARLHTHPVPSHPWPRHTLWRQMQAVAPDAENLLPGEAGRIPRADHFPRRHRPAHPRARHLQHQRGKPVPLRQAQQPLGYFAKIEALHLGSTPCRRNAHQPPRHRHHGQNTHPHQQRLRGRGGNQ